MWGEPKPKLPLMDEVPKHRKKSQRHAPRKSDHKHDPVDIIGRWEAIGTDYKTGTQYPYFRYSLMTRCSICGDLDFIPYKRRKEEYVSDNDFFCSSTNLPIKFPNLPVVDVPSQW